MFDALKRDLDAVLARNPTGWCRPRKGTGLFYPPYPGEKTAAMGGNAKKEFLRESVGEKQIELMRGIKAVVDLNGILNPGKVVEQQCRSCV